MEILAHSKASDKSFSPDQLHRVLHEVARLTAGNHTASARELILNALCDVEAYLLQATDPDTAHIIIAARAATRLRNDELRAERFVSEVA